MKFRFNLSFESVLIRLLTEMSRSLRDRIVPDEGMKISMVSLKNGVWTGTSLGCRLLHVRVDSGLKVGPGQLSCRLEELVDIDLSPMEARHQSLLGIGVCRLLRLEAHPPLGLGVDVDGLSLADRGAGGAPAKLIDLAAEAIVESCDGTLIVLGLGHVRMRLVGARSCPICVVGERFGRRAKRLEIHDGGCPGRRRGDGEWCHGRELLDDRIDECREAGRTRGPSEKLGDQNEPVLAQRGRRDYGRALRDGDLSQGIALGEVVGQAHVQRHRVVGAMKDDRDRALDEDVHATRGCMAKRAKAGEELPLV